MVFPERKTIEPIAMLVGHGDVSGQMGRSRVANAFDPLRLVRSEGRQARGDHF
jgi:hypothetical protein